LPRSLQNIFREYQQDLGLPAPTSGPLAVGGCGGAAAQPGVDGGAGHAGFAPRQGLEAVTEQAIRALVDRDREPLVAILWAGTRPIWHHCSGDVPQIVSAHPSPMSADRGFFGSRPFSRANALLADLGAAPVDWRLP